MTESLPSFPPRVEKIHQQGSWKTELKQKIWAANLSPEKMHEDIVLLVKFVY